MSVPSFTSVRRVVLLIFGLALAAWEIIFRYGEDEAVLVFLAMCLGFQPARNLDVLLRKALVIQKPPPEAPPPPPQTPASDSQLEPIP